MAKQNYKNIELTIDLDVTNIDGFDYYGLYGFPVNQITLKSTYTKGFILSNNALKDTGLQANDIICLNVVINDLGVQ